MSEERVIGRRNLAMSDNLDLGILRRSAEGVLQLDRDRYLYGVVPSAVLVEHAQVMLALLDRLTVAETELQRVKDWEAEKRVYLRQHPRPTKDRLAVLEAAVRAVPEWTNRGHAACCVCGAARIDHAHRSDCALAVARHMLEEGIANGNNKVRSLQYPTTQA